MNSKKTTVTLEDLLRLKRAERPPAEFWSEFERDMRVKQLAAIVEPRPWWAPLIRVGARVAHYQLPVGAAAILALSFITVREYRSVNLGSSDAPEAAPQIVPAEVAVSTPAAPTPSRIESPVPTASQIAALAAPAPTAPAAASAATGQISHSISFLDAVPLEREPTPSARYIAANLAAAQAADPRIMDDVFGTSVRNASNRVPVRDPLAQISSPSESRRSRLLATALPAVANSGDVSLGTSDRVARRLTEDRLYDTISRVGLKGDRVAIKF